MKIAPSEYWINAVDAAIFIVVQGVHRRRLQM
jgi:hypothetical protein